MMVRPIPRTTIDAISTAMMCSHRQVRAAITELAVSSPATFEEAADALDVVAILAAQAGWSLPRLTGVFVCFACGGWKVGLSTGTTAAMYLSFIRFDFSRSVGARMDSIHTYARKQRENGEFDRATSRVEARIEGVPEALRGHFEGLER